MDLITLEDLAVHVNELNTCHHGENQCVNTEFKVTIVRSSVLCHGSSMLAPFSNIYSFYLSALLETLTNKPYHSLFPSKVLN